MKIELKHGLFHIYTNPEELIKLTNILLSGYDELANGWEYVVHNTAREESGKKETIIHICKGHPALVVGGTMFGNVENHPRLGDRPDIYTTAITRIEGDYVHTKNTRYRVDRDEV